MMALIDRPTEVLSRSIADVEFFPGHVSDIDTDISPEKTDDANSEKMINNLLIMIAPFHL